MRERGERPARAVALCGVMAALGTADMLTGGLVPVMTYCSPLLAGLLLIPVRCEYGSERAWMVWGVTAILSMLLCADKEAAFFYLFLGYYPLIKRQIDRVKGKAVQILAKLVFFAAVLALMYILLYYILGLESVVNDFNASSAVLNLVVYFGLVVAMMIFDLSIDNLTKLYIRRIQPRITFLK